MTTLRAAFIEWYDWFCDDTVDNEEMNAEVSLNQLLFILEKYNLEISSSEGEPVAQLTKWHTTTILDLEALKLTLEETKIELQQTIKDLQKKEKEVNHQINDVEMAHRVLTRWNLYRRPEQEDEETPN